MKPLSINVVHKTILFAYSGSGVMPGRTWIFAPDAESLRSRWRKLIRAKPEQKAKLFHPHMRGGQSGDKHVNKIAKGLPGYLDDSNLLPTHMATVCCQCVTAIDHSTVNGSFPIVA